MKLKPCPFLESRKAKPENHFDPSETAGKKALHSRGLPRPETLEKVPEKGREMGTR